MACKFLSEMKEQNENRLLDRLRSWSASQHMSSQSTKYEEKIKKLVLSNGTKFPNEKIIQEFLEFSKMSEILLSKDKYLRIEWNRPSLMAIQLFNDVKQAWAYEYTAEKLIPLIVMYEHGIGTCRSIRPIRISKKKRRAFIEYYEVIWSKMVHPNDKDLSDLNEYVTLEKMDLFENFYPNLVKDFNQEIDCKKNKRNNKKKKEIKNTEDDFDDEMGTSIMELYENFDDNKLISSKDVDDFDEEMGNSIIELYENFEEKKIGKNFKVFVLDTESECEEAESKTPDAIEDVDLNMLLKSFNQISLESTKKEMPKIRDKKNTREKEHCSNCSKKVKYRLSE
ncbi:flap endonuclease -like protein [Brachionus plicatilis]|uniref:Flap endonuclease-like protein n=1 Tax=Brachionus plicatilis TaxID=10195 RepID=A0A3M7PZP1_BRAPC|nr:flap endonuclease -like protein [Brachionus plicatilis]